MPNSKLQILIKLSYKELYKYEQQYYVQPASYGVNELKSLRNETTFWSVFFWQTFDELFT